MASWAEAFPGDGSDDQNIDVAAATNHTWSEVGEVVDPDHHSVIAVAGGVLKLTPLNENFLAVFGRELTEFDSGRAQFTVGRVESGSGQGNWFYGVIFNVQRNDEDPNDASGLAVFVRATTGRAGYSSRESEMISLNRG